MILYKYLDNTASIPTLKLFLLLRWYNNDFHHNTCIRRIINILVWHYINNRFIPNQNIEIWFTHNYNNIGIPKHYNNVRLPNHYNHLRLQYEKTNDT